jgi:two-component system sensor histidine kinase MprB
VTAADRAVARGQRRQVVSDGRAQGIHVRVITTALADGGAIQFARSLETVDSALARLRVLLAILVLGGVAAATALSRLFSRRVVAPITALTDAAGHIQATGDLRRRVDRGGDDEVGHMASSFNAMLERVHASQEALEASARAQRQLVADASHELRTPIASLRTNVEVMQVDGALGDGDRAALLADVVEQTDELTALVGDLIELARGDEPIADHEDVDLAAVLAEALQRARRHSPETTFAAGVEPWPMTGSRERLARAINNVLDNATKFSPPGASVEVELRDGELSVRDHGPGVPADELPHIFDRFYRARNAAQHHGSGLGLAIVKQVVESHGGSVQAEAVPGGGLSLRLRFGGPPAGL